jgi:predicted ester cyclase
VSNSNAIGRLSAALALLLLLGACASEKAKEATKKQDFATQYTAAWCSQRAATVASFFSPDGSFQINDGAPAVGRPAITAAVRSFMTAFPNLRVEMDKLVVVDGDHMTYYWTLTGTNTGPGGTGRAVRISGHEDWRMGDDQHIAESKGHYDEADYQRQLKGG